MTDDVFPGALTDQIAHSGVIAVLVVDRVEDAAPLAEALLAGGVSIMELTLRTPAALDALRAIKACVPDMTAGIGTILTIEQARQALASGAAFGVAPGTNPRVIREAQMLGLPFAPGVATPSDIEQALECGCRLLKFFPAEPSGGLAYLKSMAAPYAHLGISYIPLGGLSPTNMQDYLREPSVAALGGSWIAPRELIKDRNWPKITANAAEATRRVAEVRGGGTS